MRWPVLLLVFVPMVGSRPAAAMPAMDMSVEVPVARLVANTAKYIKLHPKDPEGYYTMARVQSIAFARSRMQPPGPGSITVMRGTGSAREDPIAIAQAERTIKAMPTEETGIYSGKKLPEIGNTDDRMSNARPSAAELYNLGESVRYYAKATDLAPQQEYYWLGYAWMLEQGIPYAARLGSPWADTPNKRQSSTPRDWSQKAKAIYQRIYDRELMGYKFTGYNYNLVEAGAGILRLLPLPLDKTTSAEVTQRKTINATLAKVRKLPMMVSPIILPLGKARGLDGLLAKNTSVRFDLSGDGLGRRWPWVGPDTGILVWDPKHEGHITSGRQLFGSVTWWVFWKNGYQALAALDNNTDGRLSGPELEGLALWRDANSNGISDPGEVKPLAAWGIVALSTRTTQQVQGMPANLQGATNATGATLPTYDWTPRSLNE